MGTCTGCAQIIGTGIASCYDLDIDRGSFSFIPLVDDEFYVEEITVLDAGITAFAIQVDQVQAIIATFFVGENFRVRYERCNATVHDAVENSFIVFDKQINDRDGYR